MVLLTDRLFTPAQVAQIAKLVKRYSTAKTSKTRTAMWNDAETRSSLRDELLKQYSQLDRARNTAEGFQTC
jgi:hypothetical protein